MTYNTQRTENARTLHGSKMCALLSQVRRRSGSRKKGSLRGIRVAHDLLDWITVLSKVSAAAYRKDTSMELVQVLGQTRSTACAWKDRQQTNFLAGLPPEGMDKFVRIHTQTASHANGAGF